MHGDRPADARCAADDLLEFLPARDLDARTVQHARSLGAERPVHERLQVAGTQPVVTEPGAKVDCLERVETLVRQRLPHADVEHAFVAQPLEEAEVAEPAVLVVHGRDAARDGEAETCAHRVQPLLVGDLREDETAAELPRRLLAEDAARLAALVQLDDAARYLQVAVRRSERRGVEPQRMPVLRHQGRGRLARDGVERVAVRLDGGAPLAAAPAGSADPSSRRRVARGVRDARHRLVE